MTATKTIGVVTLFSVAIMVGIFAQMSPSSAQAWAEWRAYDKMCHQALRVWHVRCDLPNGTYSHACPRIDAKTFRGTSVSRTRELEDNAWWEVRVVDPSCN